jgi:hypothetical protein
MKRIVTSVLITSVLAGCSTAPTSSEIKRTTAAANDRYRPGYNGRYDGPPPSFKRDQWERRPVGFSYCNKYRNDTGKHVMACGDGVEAAVAMANKYAASHGREDGYMRGYSWGLSQAINYYQDSTDEMLRGEDQASSLDSYLSSARTEGQNAGARDGNSLGTSEAKGKYYRAVDTGVMPNPSIQTPPVNFNPTQDAYTRLVGSIPTPEDILRRDRYGRLGFYDSYDRHYGGGRDWKERNPRDLWSRGGDYRDNSGNWINGDFAFDRWLEIAGPGRRKFDSLVYLDNPNEEGRLPAQARDRDGRDRNDRPRPGPGPINTPPATPTTPAATPIVVDYKAIFKDAFIQAYNAYAPGEYSQNYHMSIDNGQRDGEAIGYEVGSEIAHRKGMARAFNRNYAQTSYSNYQQSFTNTFSTSFNSTFNEYKNNAYLTLDFLGIIGKDEDGIIQPGEDFSVKFKVINFGGVKSDLLYTVTGDVDGVTKLKNSINPISTKTITSEDIGQIRNTLEDGSRGSYILEVNGIKEQLWQAIKRPLAFADITSNVSPIDGNGMYTVVIANISTVPVNGAIAIELKVNGNSMKTVQGSPMQPGEKKSYALDFSNLDPLVWITNVYNVEILLKYNNNIFSRKTMSLSVSDSIDSLAQYYARLVNEKGSFPATTTIDNRTSEIKNMLVTRNTKEVQDNIKGFDNVYKSTPEITIPGKIAKAKESYSGNSARALGEFTSLSDAMSPDAKKFDSFLGIHPKRDSYNGILTRIGGKKYK